MQDDEIPAGFRVLESRSPFARHNGPLYQKDEEDGRFVRGFRVRDHHLNAARIGHGGWLISFMDMVLGQTVGRALAGPAVTLRLTANFVAPARRGDWVEGRAEIVRRTRQLVFVRGRLNVRHRTLLTGDGIFQPVRPAAER